MLGVSFDPPERQQPFHADQEFPFRLLCDVDQAMGIGFETKRPADHPATNWAMRITYLIDPDGIVRDAWEVTDVQAHANEVLEQARRLITQL